MLTKETLENIFKEFDNETGVVLSQVELNAVFDTILKEQGENETEAVKKFAEQQANELRIHYGGSILHQLEGLFENAKDGSRTAIASKKKLIEDALVYFRSVTMIAESIGMAGTHAEKSARLRGLIELLNSAISKLRKDEHEALLQNWSNWSWSYSDYPYQKVLEEYKDLKRQNDAMKKALEKSGVEVDDDLPF